MKYRNIKDVEKMVEEKMARPKATMVPGVASLKAHLDELEKLNAPKVPKL